MTREELEHIQSVCRGWLRLPDTAQGSSMTIPPGGVLTRETRVKASAILTFDNVPIVSAVDAETGVCYTSLVGRQGEAGELFDTSWEKIASQEVQRAEPPPKVLRATQQRYRDVAERLALAREAANNVPLAGEASSDWIEKENLEADARPKYLLYTNQTLLGYSLLERTRSGGERSGRFHASENYFDYFEIFAALPEIENEALEANVREAYGIFDGENSAHRTRFNELAAQVTALELYVTDDTGLRIEGAAVRLEDLSQYYHDPTERWLYITGNARQD
jgi:hypothetical protein